VTAVQQIFTQCSQIISAVNTPTPHCDIAFRFGMPGQSNEGDEANFADFALKLVAMTTSLELSEKKKAVSYEQMPTIR